MNTASQIILAAIGQFIGTVLYCVAYRLITGRMPKRVWVGFMWINL